MTATAPLGGDHPCFPPECSPREIFPTDHCGGPDLILLRSAPARASARCPCCGRESRSPDGVFWRRADDLPCLAVLRLVHALPLPRPPAPHVLEVDDWAIRRGDTCGAMLVDLECERVVDPLPDRTSTTLAEWLRACPEPVEIIARDRSSELARSAAAGAPAAVQVADPWHLLHNAKQMLEMWLSAVHARLLRLQLESLGAASVEPTGKR